MLPEYSFYLFKSSDGSITIMIRKVGLNEITFW